jgi:O-acetyl-ADP-ribose deacetylase (regulator of RNase III)
MQNIHNINIIHGDVLTQEVDVIVNPWNRNFIPWWLLLPQGVSGAIKKKAGFRPFVELSKVGILPLGGAVLTSAGKLPYKGIIHVAGLNAFWVSTEKSIRQSVRSAMQIVNEQGFQSVAFPLIGAGTGGKKAELVHQWIIETLNEQPTNAEITVVIYNQP